MGALPIRGAFADKLPHATVFRAWRVTESGAPIPLDTAGALTVEEAINAALGGGQVVLHKETVLVHGYDGGRRKGVLHGFVIKRRSRPEYLRDPETGRAVQAPAEYPEPTFNLAVDVFEPARPFDALRDCASGCDLTLVEAR